MALSMHKKQLTTCTAC